MNFSMSFEQIQVQVCALCGQNIRPHRQIPPHCLPQDPLTGRVVVEAILTVLGSCPVCHQPVRPSEIAELRAKYRTWSARQPDRCRDVGVTQCPPGSAALPWDW